MQLINTSEEHYTMQKENFNECIIITPIKLRCNNSNLISHCYTLNITNES